MALSLKDKETDSLAREVASLTGESLTEAVRGALRLRLRHERLRRGRPADLADELDAIARRGDALPILDYRSADEILGYDENGPAVLMVIDSSALIAIMLGEPERRSFIEAITTADTCLIGAPTMMEASMVVLSRFGEGRLEDLREFCVRGSVEVIAFGPEHLGLAIDAFRRFGKGRHPAGLNFGDCFSYALAKATGEPLLFKGDDFSHTDVTRAL